MKLPPVRGKIFFEGLASTKFWIRVFGLEAEVAFTQSKINEKPERTTAAVPIINDYEVDPGRLKFYYAIVLHVDALGIHDGTGMVLFADKENAETAITERNKLADRILKSLSARHFDEELPLEAYVVEGGKET